MPPAKLHSSILFAPVGELVPVALRALDRGGTLALAGIYMTPVPQMDYQECLFEERNLRSVTANTRHDGETLLRLWSRSKDLALPIVNGFRRESEELR